MEPSRQRPARYRPAAPTQSYVPPRYRRKTDTEEGSDSDDEEEFKPDIGVKEVLNGLAVFVILTLLFLTVQRWVFIDARDPYKCAAITNHGRWLESSNSTVPLNTWQPQGCLLHTYTADDIASCLPGRRILYIGDESIKAIFYATVDKFSSAISDNKDRTWYRDEHFSSGTYNEGAGVNVEFVWDPYLNSTKLAEELKPWKNGSITSEWEELQAQGKYDPPAFFIVGAGIWSADHSPNPHKRWRSAVDEVAKHMRWGDRDTFFGGKDMLMLAPVAQPAWEKLGLDKRAELRSVVAGDMHRYIEQLATIQGLDIIRSWRVDPDGGVGLVMENHIYNQYHSKEVEEDGVTLLSDVAERRLDMVLGLRCNDFLRKHGEKIQSDCCIKYEKPGWFQGLFLLRLIWVIPAVRIWRWKFPKSWLHVYGPGNPEVLKRLWHLSLVLMLAYYADRTPIFDKQHKLLTPQRFHNALFGVLVLSLLTLQSPRKKAKPQALELRIWNEWRGAALALHMVSVYVGGYTEFSTFALLFVHSAEWTVELLKTNVARTGAEFVAQKLGEINVVVLPLVFVVKSEYVLYRLPMALSFWFLVVYATVRIRSVRNRDFKWYAGKLVISAGLVLAWFWGPGVYRGALTVIGYLCRIAWDEDVVRGLVLKHIWGVYVGMAAGWVYTKVFLASKGDLRRRYEYYAAGVAGCFGVSYILLMNFGGEDREWEAWHSYNSLARIALFGTVRVLVQQVVGHRQSEFLVWLGSIQTGVLGLMDHVWLAGDGEGILDLGIWGFDDYGVLLNFIAWTAVFGYLCWTVRDAGQVVVQWGLGNDRGLEEEHEETQRLERRDDIGEVEMKGGDVPFKHENGHVGLSLKARVISVFVAAWILNWTT